MEQFVLLLRTGRCQRMSDDLRDLCVKHGFPVDVSFKYVSDTADVARLAESDDPKPVLVIATGELKDYVGGMGHVVNARRWITELAALWGSELEFVLDSD